METSNIYNPTTGQTLYGASYQQLPQGFQVGTAPAAGTVQSKSGGQVYRTAGGQVSTDPNALIGGYAATQDDPLFRKDTSGMPTSPLTTQPSTGMATSPMNAAPQYGQPNPTQNPPLQGTTAPTVPEAIKNIETPAPTPTGQKYQQTFNNLQQNGGVAPTSPAAARVAVSQATPPPTPEAYKPTPSFIQFADPIMQQIIGQALTQKQQVTDSGYTASNLKSVFANQLANMDTQALNLKTIMAGTVDDIRNEINKAGGFATESQVQGMVVTRNKDLLRQSTLMEVQRQNLQNQMQMQVQLADTDRQYAVDNYNNTMQAYQLYDGIKKNATTQIDQLVNRVGYQGLAAAYNNDPNAMALAEKALGLPENSLTDPNKLNALETYREKSLALSASRYTAQYGISPGGVTNGTPSTGIPTTETGTTGTPSQTVNQNGATYAQYGKLAQTDFNPNNDTDNKALNYLNVYLNNGKVPNAYDIGISSRGAIGGQQFNTATKRANDLYFSATGENLPSPEIVKGNLKLITANNTLANNLRVQEKTVNANFGLSLENLNANNINKAWPILNNAINAIKNAEGDPTVAQYFAQNSTIQQELGNLLAVKNASGTTVYDKIAGAGLMPKNATPEQQVTIAKTLLQEAQNAGKAISDTNGELYQSVDPLERQTANPNRQGSLHTTPTLSDLRTRAPKGQVLIKRNGQAGYIPEGEYNSQTDTKL